MSFLPDAACRAAQWGPEGVGRQRRRTGAGPTGALGVSGFITGCQRMLGHLAHTWSCRGTCHGSCERQGGCGGTAPPRHHRHTRRHRLPLPSPMRPTRCLSDRCCTLAKRPARVASYRHPSPPPCRHLLPAPGGCPHRRRPQGDHLHLWCHRVQQHRHQGRGHVPQGQEEARHYNTGGRRARARACTRTLGHLKQPVGPGPLQGG